MEGERLKVDILGASFHVQANEDISYLRSVVAYLKNKVEEVRAEVGVADPLKIALLAGLNIVDELFKEQRKTAGGSSGDFAEIGRITERLIRRIDETLAE